MPVSVDYEIRDEARSQVFTEENWKGRIPTSDPHETLTDW